MHVRRRRWRGGLIFISARRRWDFLARVNIAFLVSGRNLDHQKSALSPTALALQAGRDKGGLGGGGEAWAGHGRLGFYFDYRKVISGQRQQYPSFGVGPERCKCGSVLRESANANLRIRLPFGETWKKRIWAYAWQTATFMGFRWVPVFLFWRFYPHGSCFVVHFLLLSLSPPAVITLIPFTCAALAAIHLCIHCGCVLFPHFLPFCLSMPSACAVVLFFPVLTVQVCLSLCFIGILDMIIGCFPSPHCLLSFSASLLILIK